MSRLHTFSRNVFLAAPGPRPVSTNVSKFELRKPFAINLDTSWKCVLENVPFMIQSGLEAGPMRVGLYARVSTNKQENENQLSQMREFVSKQHGWEIVHEYVDTVTGSGKRSRVQFDAMMLAASQKKFDLLLFWKLDRFSREGVRKTLRYLGQLDSYGVAWRSFMEPFFDSCGIMRDVVISIMATLAEQERINISDRTKAGLQRARRAGKKLGRSRTAVDLVQARRLRAKGLGLRGTAKKLSISVNTLRKALQG
jgi:DNA invertase Pin-like site-specific DNA recombinase